MFGKYTIFHVTIKVLPLETLWINAQIAHTNECSTFDIQYGQHHVIHTYFSRSTEISTIHTHSHAMKAISSFVLQNDIKEWEKKRENFVYGETSILHILTDTAFLIFLLYIFPV